MSATSRTPVRGVLATLAAIAAGTTLSACAAGDAPTPAARTVSTAVPVASATTATPTESVSPTNPGGGAPGARPLDRLAPSKPVPVKRGGKVPKPSFTAAARAFDQKVSYADGLTLAVSKTDQGSVEGQGPGVFAGDPRTTFTLTLTNGTSKPIRLDAVVVAAQYGKPARVARPVYGPTAVDFSGVVAPGGKSSASYAFTIPKTGLKNVVMTVDFDGLHTAATFHGAAQ